ncbi:hypothetical protein SAMN03159444_00113 [Pseudomonas sp. NFACC02]|uniref:hypothetical protein n=1 Tax=Pseudomonas sp. NFACC02 TaxID=1566250 RepID=UPI0008CD9498|nr:hypothetical protein [Pseudomonas sp. NFACC02]SEP58013.1 hypothetical protein SAMN03159444_00113 [Pseudomonas sp. NFACC02]
MNSRNQFEARFPVPEGVAWNPETSRYVLVHLKRATVSIYEAHVERWAVWQAACDAMQKELHPFRPAQDLPTIGHTGCVICGQFTDHGGLQCPKLRAYSFCETREVHQ